ncbi:MAG: MFS transporter [Elusimicrobia bacterium]|nr:MFS transporter [Elusimicrobiota bacterium]
MKTVRGLWLLFGCQTLLAAGLSLSFPFFALYLHRDRGVSMSVVGVCLSISFLMTAVGQGLGGELADLVGRRRVLMFGLFSRAAAALAIACAMWLQWPAPLIVVFHFIASLVGNFYDPAARSWVADRTHEDERIKAYGILRIAENVGWATGPAFGGVMAETSYPLLFAITAGACVIGGIAVFVGIPESSGVLRSDPFQFRSVLKAGEDRRFLNYSLFLLLLSVVMAQLVVSLSIFATTFLHLSERNVGLLFTLNGAMVVLLQYPVSAGLTRYRLTSGLVAGSVLYAIGYLCVGFAGGFAALCAAMAVVTLGEISVAPGVISLAANLAPTHEKGRYQGFSGLMRQAGMALGPLTGCYALQYVGPRWAAGPWIGVSVLGGAAAAGFLVLRSSLTAREEGLPEDS